MAELHRRVLRFQGGQRVARLLAALTCVAALSTAAHADAPTVHEIETWAGELRSGDQARTQRAYERLGHLPEAALPAIEERLQRTSRQIVPEEDGYDALRYFRHAVGSRRADDMVDIAPGIVAALQERPTPEVGRSAERLLLLRSLEAIGTVPAQRLMGDVLALTPSMWRWERRRLLDRMGTRLLPGLLWMKRHDEPDVRQWARGAIAQLGMNEPGRAVQEEDPERLAGILEAYSVALEMDAMNVIISFVGHNDERVRSAAREAMNRFGRNGIWRFREAMRNQLGREADREWGWERTSRELYEGLDAQRLAPVNALVEEGLAAIEEGDFGLAKQRFDAALLREPMHPQRAELAGHYAAFAEAAVAPDEKATLFQRALWLDPESAEATRWNGQLLRLEADRYAAQGFVDEAAMAESEAALADAQSTEAVNQTKSPPYVEWLLGLLGVLALFGFGWAGWKKRAARPRVVAQKERVKVVRPALPVARLRHGLRGFTGRLSGLVASTATRRASTDSDSTGRNLAKVLGERLRKGLSLLMIASLEQLRVARRLIVRLARPEAPASQQATTRPRTRVRKLPHSPLAPNGGPHSTPKARSAVKAKGVPKGRLRTKSAEKAKSATSAARSRARGDMAKPASPVATLSSLMLQGASTKSTKAKPEIVRVIRRPLAPSGESTSASGAAPESASGADELSTLVGDELPPGFFHDTSPGAIEAPDTLPG